MEFGKFIFDESAFYPFRGISSSSVLREKFNLLSIKRIFIQDGLKEQEYCYQRDPVKIIQLVVLFTKLRSYRQVESFLAKLN